MRIAIDAPPVRSLSANEKMVYQFLKEGYTPQEIGERMKIPVGRGFFQDNVHDVPNDTVCLLISKIREKGWNIPNDNKEEDEMQKLTEENKRIIITANSAGATVTSLAEKYNVSKTAIYNVIKDFNNRGETALSGETEIETKEEPATAATETGSEQEICDNIPADIIPENHEDVKPESKENIPIIPESVLEACRERRLNLQKDIEDFEASIDDWKRQIEEINDFIALAKMCNPVGGTL